MSEVLLYLHRSLLHRSLLHRATLHRAPLHRAPLLDESPASIQALPTNLEAISTRCSLPVKGCAHTIQTAIFATKAARRKSTGDKPRCMAFGFLVFPACRCWRFSGYRGFGCTMAPCCWGG